MKIFLHLSFLNSCVDPQCTSLPVVCHLLSTFFISIGLLHISITFNMLWSDFFFKKYIKFSIFSWIVFRYVCSNKKISTFSAKLMEMCMLLPTINPFSNESGKIRVLVTSEVFYARMFILLLYTFIVLYGCIYILL